MAPNEFHRLLESQVTDTDVKNQILSLLERKAKGEELNEEPKIQILNDFLEDKIRYNNEYVRSIQPIAQPDTALLNELFIQTIGEVWAAG